MLARYADDVAAAVRAAARGRSRRRGRVGRGDRSDDPARVRVARDQAELVLAELSELAPGRAGGARRRRRHRRVRDLRRPGRAAVAARPPRGGRRRARRRLDHRAGRRLGRTAGARGIRRSSSRRGGRTPARAPAVGGAAAGHDRRRDRARAGVRHRRARDDAPVARAADGARAGRRALPTGAAAPACWRSPRRGSASGRCSPATSRRRRWPPRATAARDNGVEVEVVALRPAARARARGRRR